MRKLDAVFIQPTFDCALNCKDCYVKTSSQGPQLSHEVLESLIRYLWIGDKFWTRQVTVAVDDLPKDLDARSRMTGALSTALRMRKKFNWRNTELHITCNSINTLQGYIDAGLPLQYIAKNVDLLSISHLGLSDLPMLETIRQFCPVNYNFIPTRDLSEYKEVLNHVDQSYLIFKKAGLGIRNDPRDIDLFRKAVKELSNSPEAQGKVKVDGCVRDVVQARREGVTCSAGISRLHIWPDGHSTGCPYNKMGSKHRPDLHAILEGMAEITSSSDFRSCTVAEVLENRPRLHVL